MQTVIEKNILHTSIKGNGKLLFSGEYFVLDGAKALALPCKFGQAFEIIESINNFENNFIYWNAYNVQQEIWLSTKINMRDLTVVQPAAKEADTLVKMLRICKELNSSFLHTKNDLTINAYLEFPNNWGLGSSSTLIYFMSKWANVNPYRLLEKTFGGSGYDIACAEHQEAIYYTRNDANPIVEKVRFNPDFTKHIYFVHLNEKMNSRNAISYYKNLAIDKKNIVDEISHITECFVQSKDLTEFEKCMLAHELIVSQVLKIERVKNTLFKNYWGEVKSLGAWGGDFVMVTNNREEVEFTKYMNERGFETILKYDDMILNTPTA